MVFTIFIGSAYVLYTFAETFSILDFNSRRGLKMKIDSPLSTMVGVAKIVLGNLLFQTFKYYFGTTKCIPSLFFLWIDCLFKGMWTGEPFMQSQRLSISIMRSFSDSPNKLCRKF